MEDFILRLAIGIPGFVIAVIFHEAAHGYVAHFFGDDTAKRAGRLTLNPIAHFDMFGTVIFPLIGAMIGGVMFGWAKPVPVDVSKFKNHRHGLFWVSFAGPAMNIILGVISALLMAVMLTAVPQDFYLWSPFVQILRQSVLINFVLAVFNLIPLPPLDGSKMVSAFLNYTQAMRYEALQQYTFTIFLGIIALEWVVHISIFGYILSPAFFMGDFFIKSFYQLLA